MKAIIYAMALTAIQTPPAPPWNDATREVLQNAIKDRLADGDSAKWRWLPFRPSAGGEAHYCGFYNAKNQMGGYVGFNPVWVSGRWQSETFVATDVQFARGPYLDGTAAKRCIADGYSLSVIPPATGE